jgi:hypothetical protein
MFVVDEKERGTTVEPESESTEALIRRQVALCERLLDCVVRERETLIDLDVNRLWSITEEKRRILRLIEKAQVPVIRQNRTNSSQVLPPERRRVARDLSQRLDLLKEEIRARAADNVRFVDETLGFFDELVSILAIGTQRSESYQPIGRARKGSLPLIYSKEV